MKGWVLDIIVGVSALIVFGILLFALPMVMPAAYGYIGALILFVVYLTVAGMVLLIVCKLVTVNKPFLYILKGLTELLKMP